MSGTAHPTFCISLTSNTKVVAAASAKRTVLEIIAGLLNNEVPAISTTVVQTKSRSPRIATVHLPRWCLYKIEYYLYVLYTIPTFHGTRWSPTEERHTPISEYSTLRPEFEISNIVVWVKSRYMELLENFTLNEYMSVVWENICL